MQKQNAVRLLFLLSFLVLIVVYFLSTSKHDRRENIEESFDFENEDGTKRHHVFIDLGANIGDSIRYFLDEDASGRDFKGYAAKNPLINWEIYAVEANPFFNTHLDELKLYCEKLGHQVFLYKQTAAWIKNEKLTFYLDTVNPQHNYWGSSLKTGGRDVRNSNYTNIEVNGIDVSEMLKKYTKNDEVIMKIDIEGTEYELLEHLMKQKTLDLVDMIAVEFHNNLPQLSNYFIKSFKARNIKFVRWSKR